MRCEYCDCYHDVEEFCEENNCCTDIWWARDTSLDNIYIKWEAIVLSKFDKIIHYHYVVINLIRFYLLQQIRTIEQFSNEYLKTKTGVITLTNQKERKTIHCPIKTRLKQLHVVRENLREQVTVGFSFTCDWSRKWRRPSPRLIPAVAYSFAKESDESENGKLTDARKRTWDSFLPFLDARRTHKIVNERRDWVRV